MRNIENFYNLERTEFVQVVDFRARLIRTMTWEEFWGLEDASWIKRLPFRSELISEEDVRKDFFDIHEINKPYGVNFWEFLIAERLKEDFREYETARYRRALLQWFESHNLFSKLKLDVYLDELE